MDRNTFLIRNLLSHVAGVLLLITLPSAGWGIVLPEESEEINATASSQVPGQKTASGEKYEPSKLSCSHHSLPFGTVLRVQNQLTGKSIDVKVNDRSLKSSGEIKMSTVAAEMLGLEPGKTIPVLATPVGITTAQLEPVSEDNLQKNAILVNFNPNAYDASAFLPGSQDEIEARANENLATHQTGEDPAGFPTLDFQQSTTLPTTSAQQSVFEDTHGHQHQRVLFVDKSENVPTNTIGNERVTAAPQATEDRRLRAQFGAFGDYENAAAMMNELNGIGFETKILQMGRIYYVVTEGTFTSQVKAEVWRAEVKRLHGKDVATIRL